MLRFASSFFLLLLTAALYAQSPLKAAFGQGGKTSYSHDQFNDVVDVAVANGDSLFVLAYCGHSDTMYFNTDIAVTKMDALGNIDPSFGVNGTAKYDFDGMDYSTASELMICSDGRILVMGAGYAFADPYYNPICLMMLTSNGQIDQSFGVSGTAKISFYGKHEIGASITADSNGNLLIAGASADTADNENVPVIGRFSEYMNADTTFGGTGKLVIDLAAGLQSLKSIHLAGGIAFDVISLNDGSLLVGGSYAADCFVAKLLPGGTLDTAFGNGGYILFQAEQQYNNVVKEMMLLPDGMIFMGITSDKTYDRDYYTAVLDPLTGSISGMNYIDYSAREDLLSGLALTPQGSVVMAGRCIKPENALTAGYRSDYFSVTILHDIEQLSSQQKILVQYDPSYQSGASAAAVQSDGTIICAGFTNTAVPGQSDIALIAIDPAYYLNVNVPDASDNVLSVFPNPVNDIARISNIKPGSVLTLRNALGKVVFTTTAEQHHADISLEDLSLGIYFLSADEPGSSTCTIRIIRL